MSSCVSPAIRYANRLDDHGFVIYVKSRFRQPIPLAYREYTSGCSKRVSTSSTYCLILPACLSLGLPGGELRCYEFSIEASEREARALFFKGKKSSLRIGHNAPSLHFSYIFSVDNQPQPVYLILVRFRPRLSKHTAKISVPTSPVHAHIVANPFVLLLL